MKYPSLPHIINVSVFLATAMLAFLLFTGLLYRAYSLTLANPVPSGDDPAIHIYIALKVVEDPLSIVQLRVYNYTTIPLQYPNLIHVAMALLYVFTGNILDLVEFIKIFSFISIVLGIVLYTYIIYMLAKPLDSSKKAELTMAYVALASLLSFGIFQTLSDGSIMELFAVLVTLPLTVTLLLKEKYFAAGAVLGLSSLSTLGFIQTMAAALPWVFSFIVNRRLKALLQTLAGMLLGGNVFLARDSYKLAVYLLTTLSSVRSGNPSPITLPLDALAAYKVAEIFLAYMVIYAISLPRCWQQRSREVLLTMTIWTAHGMLVFILPGILHYPSDALWRFVRVNMFLASIAVTLSIYTDARDLTAGGQIRIMGVALLGAILLTSLFTPTQYKPLGPTNKLLRVDYTKLQAYLALRDWLLENGKPNSTILAIPQVSSWAAAFLTIPQKNIHVFLVATPDVYSTYSPDDPNRALGLKFYKAVVNRDLDAFKGYTVRYILVEQPKEGQFYYESIKEFADRMWSEDLSKIANVTFYRQDVGMKLWQLRDP